MADPFAEPFDAPPPALFGGTRKVAGVIALVFVLGFGAHLVLQLRPLSIGRTVPATITFNPPCTNGSTISAFGERWEAIAGDVPTPLDFSPVRGSFRRDSKERATFRTADGHTGRYRPLHDRFPVLGCSIRGDAP